MNQEIKNQEKELYLELLQHQIKGQLISIDTRSFKRNGKPYYFQGIVDDLNEKEVHLFDLLNEKFSIVSLSDISRINLIRNLSPDKFRQIQINREKYEQEKIELLGEISDDGFHKILTDAEKARGEQ